MSINKSINQSSSQVVKTYHVNQSIIHLYSDTEKEGKEQLVPLKQTATHIGVETEGEEVVDVGDSLRDVI